MNNAGRGTRVCIVGFLTNICYIVYADQILPLDVGNYDDHDDE
jgi:hypothetical protein